MAERKKMGRRRSGVVQESPETPPAPPSSAHGFSAIRDMERLLMEEMAHNYTECTGMVTWCLEKMEAISPTEPAKPEIVEDLVSNMKVLVLGKERLQDRYILYLDSAFQRGFFDLWHAHRWGCTMTFPEVVDFMDKVAVGEEEDPRVDMLRVAAMAFKLAGLMVLQRAERRLAPQSVMLYHLMAVKALVILMTMALLVDDGMSYMENLDSAHVELKQAMRIAQQLPETDKPPHHYRLRIALTAAYVEAYFGGRLGKANKMWDHVRKTCTKGMRNRKPHAKTKRHLPESIREYNKNMYALEMVLNLLNEQVRRIKLYLQKKKEWKHVWKENDRIAMYTLHRSVDFRSWPFFKRQMRAIPTAEPSLYAHDVLKVDGQKITLRNKKAEERPKPRKVPRSPVVLKAEGTEPKDIEDSILFCKLYKSIPEYVHLLGIF